ncbi:MAG: adenylyl-sulfate kinase [Proteobacteria bacterium]|nr:adenylyl-sulfate kinase [Pseudomonadota bacterium]
MTPASQKATNVTWQEGLVSRQDRYQILRQKGATIWFTGLSGSGKSTIAIALERALFRRGKLSYRLDGDNVRLGINKNLGFSEADRTENIRRIGEVAKLFGDAGTISLSAFISPYAADRDEVRRLHEDADLRFVFGLGASPPTEAERRDPKGLYKRARAGEIRNFTGIDDPYEAPANPEIHLRTDRLTVKEEVSAIIGYLERHGIIESGQPDESPSRAGGSVSAERAERGGSAGDAERSADLGDSERRAATGDAG